MKKKHIIFFLLSLIIFLLTIYLCFIKYYYLFKHITPNLLLLFFISNNIYLFLFFFSLIGITLFFKNLEIINWHHIINLCCIFLFLGSILIIKKGVVSLINKQIFLKQTYYGKFSGHLMSVLTILIGLFCIYLSIRELIKQYKINKENKSTVFQNIIYYFFVLFEVLIFIDNILIYNNLLR